MKILRLTLKKKWFDMILSGEKKEEYREIKPYWETRLLKPVQSPFVRRFKKYDFVEFKNGYAKDAPTIVIECVKIDYGDGQTEWGAILHEHYFVINLGNIILTENIK